MSGQAMRNDAFGTEAPLVSEDADKSDAKPKLNLLQRRGYIEKILGQISDTQWMTHNRDTDRSPAMRMPDGRLAVVMRKRVRGGRKEPEFTYRVLLDGLVELQASSLDDLVNVLAMEPQVPRR